MSDLQYDVVIIGGGPGGYVAAIRAAQLGFKTACVEKRGALGGTCLNVGCIPSKALLQSSEKYAEARHSLADHGVKMSDVALDLAAMMKRKDKVVGGLTKGIESLLKKNKVDYLKGSGALAGKGRIKVGESGGKTHEIQAKHIVLATGSEVTPLKGVDIDEKRIVTSTGALALSEVPKRLVVIGAGVIGLELGSVWSRLGSQVTVIEFLDRILPGMDGETAKLAQRVLAKQGLDFRLGKKVTAAKASKTGVKLSVEPAKGDGESEAVEAEVVLVAIGRRPYTEGLGLKAAGVECDERGFVKVDRRYRTTASGVYAIGDCIHGPMLAHKAEEDGVACAEMIAGENPHVDYDKVPGVVYTWPEIAGVGKTEEQLKEAGVEYRSGKFPFMANSRARTNAETDGQVKILADAKTDRVLGVHILGPLAGDIIGEAVAVMEFGGSAEDIARTCHAHPGVAEAVKEAAMAVSGRAIHI